MYEFNHIIINKNRGWRGLAEAVVRSEGYKDQLKMIFSFSQAVWDDLVINHKIVMQDDEYYYIIRFFDNKRELPTPEQQRSVLIKNFVVKIDSVNKIKKEEWQSVTADDWTAILHFLKNRNNHTTSDWNCIGIRVIPEI